MSHEIKKVYVVGAGLAGSECAFQLADRGYKVHLIEMRGQKMTPAHKTPLFAELVCSNSLGSATDYSAPGQLKYEAEKLGSLILKSAYESRVPAGMALGVDRDIFSKNITLALENHPNITIEKRVVESLDEIPRPAVIATGPLTDLTLADSLKSHFDDEFLYFFDAIAPIIDTESINMDKAWKADRWDKGTKDYINCPLNKEQYYLLINEIKAARKVVPKEFELNTPYFEACMPVEEIIERGDETLRFGPLSPKGLTDPKTGTRAYAVVQLRQENKEATAYNMVGFQTKMAYPEQKRIFSMIPGLEEAEFLKLGSIHRNLYIHSPKKLNPDLSSKKDPWLFFAGQITGVEGYFESTCIGLLVSQLLADKMENRPQQFPPRASAMGSLLNALNEEKEQFQPTNINFGLFPKLDITKTKPKLSRQHRRDATLKIAKDAFTEWLKEVKH
ncbi:MAG: methylenetetrahydrofolate--tRNA-(uracil(54)-C(5))-methyltransferase (FADH(2)-oxidizing) TrmFO [Bdellovibrionaceae bacterium]|nr:methylenetetrahydrofolate--tRNA-(uracil(54)-C(5))-methyltransferase (FADH(2)-oxidizing) TrmFO [Pseudobdellovibrionaceae bacterium]